MFEKELSGLRISAESNRVESPMPVLELRGVDTHAEGAGMSLNGIDLTIQPGEIVGVAGVSGNGQKELCDVVLGMEPCVSGRKIPVRQGSHQSFRSHDAPERSRFHPGESAADGFSAVHDRAGKHGPDGTWRYARRGGLAMDWRAVKADVDETVKRLGFTVNLYAIAKALSGGNLQRMVILREMTHDPRLIIASYLTRGLDVQSAMAARQALIQAREGGAGVLLVSEDLDELFTLSDRLMVLYGGKIVGEFKPAETDIYEVGHLMTGSKVEHVITPLNLFRAARWPVPG